MSDFEPLLKKNTQQSWIINLKIVSVSSLSSDNGEY